MTHQLASRSTDSFRELLIKANASLLVSTYQAGKLVLVRADSNGVNTHFLGFEKPMGLAWKPGQLAVAGVAGIVSYRNLPAVGSKTGQGEAADACYVPRTSQRTGAVDIHEMGFDAEGALWFVNTRMSCLATTSEQYSFVPRWRPPFISAYDLADRCHLNGLGFRDGRPRYVSMLGASDVPEGWRRNKVSGGMVMDVERDEVLYEQLCMPHSPRWYRDRLWFLSSGSGQLMAAVPGQAPEVVAEVPGFARGLNFIDHYALIGLSQVRESAVFAGIPLTRRVAERKAGVWVVDLDTGATVAFLEFTGAVQEVFEVRVLPHRFPVMLEADDPLVASSFELPDEVVANLAPPDPIEQALGDATRLHLDGQLEEAVTRYRAILEERPEHPRAAHQLGLCYVDAERWQDAVDELTAVVERQPANAEAMNSLGLAWYRLGDLERGLNWLDRSIAADRQFALAHFNRGLILLKQGRYREGWPEYDWRWQTPRFVPFQCAQPLWHGEDISDKRLLVHSEQGNGDHLQFMRFLPLAASRCRELIYVGPESLAPLAARIPGVAESRVPGQIANDRFDLYCPLMSLPRWLDITLENLPAPERYLEIPPQVVVSQLEGDFRVGVSWAGSPTQQDDKWRSVALEAFVPLFGAAGVRYYSLQMPVSSDEAALLERHGVTNLEPELPGYARTAALVDQLDLVISIDTAIAHLAGALGRPTWVLLNTDPDWRWMSEGERTPWYPNTRLFRQRAPGDWEELIQRVAGALEAHSRATA